MLNDIFRKILTFLSFPNNIRKEHSNIKKEKIFFFVKQKVKKIQKEKKYKLQTHNIFSNKVFNLILKHNLINFLRHGFIQKMFFVHNRFYLFFLLIQIKKKKKLSNLLPEKSVGNPIPYFLCRSTSGNRIRHVYHLYRYLEFKKIIADVFIEIGGGYGCMASIINQYVSKKKYIIFDTEEVVLLQYYYLKNLNISVGFNEINKDVILVSSVNDLLKLLKKFKLDRKFIISNWAMSEMPITLRNQLNQIILKSESFLISFQSQFENLNNYKYFKKIKKNVPGSVILPIKEMNFLNKNKHYYFFK